MKVIHLISGGDTGGAKTHIHLMLSRLNDAVEEALLVCFMEGPFAQEAREMGIPTLVLTGSVPACIRQLRQRIRREGYCLIHCHGSRGNLMGMLLKPLCGVPVISTIHSDPKLDYMHRPAARLIYGTLNAIALRHMDFLVAVSESMRRLLITRGFAPNRIFTIYNGVDFAHPLPETDRTAYFGALGFPVAPEDVVVGIAARLNPVKDIATLIRGFAMALEKSPRLRLVIAGEGEERPALEALAKELGVAGKVCFAGWVSDMDTFYSVLDINTLTSLSETFPYALTEGARAHLPTVSSAVGGVPDLIEDGVNGLLFPPGDAEALARHLAALGEDAAARRRLGEALYARAKARFSADATCTRQLEIYSAVLRRDGCRRRGERLGVLICGAYGWGNAGDDAILEAILCQMRDIDAEMPVTVLSRCPKETRLRYGVDALYTFNLPAFLRRMGRVQLFINGGGSLIQDVTSRRSLWYYLFTIYAAKKRGDKVIMYGCGIGPVDYKGDVRLTRRVLNRYVDVITLREPDSRDTLRAFGVDAPEIHLTADPALSLKPASAPAVDAAMARLGLDPGGRYVCFALRPWEGFAPRAEAFTTAASYAYEKYGLTAVFLSINHRSDAAASDMAISGLKTPYILIREPMPARLAIGLMGRMTAVVSMRLHGLIFAAAGGVPLIGVSYDPKVTSFLSYIGQAQCIALKQVTAAGLCAMLDTAVAQSADRAGRAAAAEHLAQLEAGNAACVRRLLAPKAD